MLYEVITPHPVILTDENNRFEYMNHEAALLFEDSLACGIGSGIPAGDGSGNLPGNTAVGSVELCLPGLDDELAAFSDGSDLTCGFEKTLTSEAGDKIYASYNFV